MDGCGYEVSAEVVERIYEAALRGRPWDDVAAGVMESVGGDQALMATFSATAHAPLGKAGSIDDGSVALCQARYSVNPWTEAMADVRLGEAISLDRAIPFCELEKTGFYADILRPCGISNGAGLLVQAEGPDWVGLSLGRSARSGPFEARALGVAEAYGAHMRRALGLAARFDGMERVHRAELEALDMLDAAALLLDGAGRLVAANRSARALAAAGVLEFGADGPACADRAGRTAFKAAVLVAAQGFAPAPVRFRDADDAPFALIAAPIGARAAERLSQAGAGWPAVMLFVFGAAGRAGPSPALLEALFGLTPAEARVAAELALGDGEAAASRRLGLSVNSLKTHRRRIFDKVGVTRQAQLARLLARLPSAA